MLFLFSMLACTGSLPAPVHVDQPVASYRWTPIEGSGNVMVVLIDDIGVDKVGVYGSPYAAHTPHLDQLAADGLRFDNAYASPMCSPARALLLTGRHSRRTGIGTITERKASRESQLSTDAVLIPEVLDHAPGGAWANGAIGKWHLAGVGLEDWPSHPNRSGFDHFAGGRGNPKYKPDRGYALWSRNVNGVVADHAVYLTTATADDALARIAEMPEPWFLYVAFNAAHVPIHDPPAALRPSAVPAPEDRVAKHDVMIAVLDREIGRLMASIDPAVRARTTVVTMGDNGTARFGLRKGQGPGRRHIKHSVFEGGVRVPMIVNGPHVGKPGTTTDALVHIADILPTVADLAGMKMEGEHLPLPTGPLRLDGKSLMPLVRGEVDQHHEMIYSEVFEPNGPGPYQKDHRGLRNATHRLIVRDGVEGFYRLGDGWWEASGDLLDPESGDTLTPADQQQLDALRLAMQANIEELVHEGR